jgi:hypothetical protein
VVGLSGLIFEVLPHDLAAAIMEQRAELSRKMLVAVSPSKLRGWSHFLTGDESWFWFILDYVQ